MKTTNNQSISQVDNKIIQQNTYKVVYSDGIRILDYIIAPNISEAKKIAAENNRTKKYGTSFYKVCRCYSGGVYGSNGLQNWH